MPLKINGAFDWMKIPDIAIVFKHAYTNWLKRLVYRNAIKTAVWHTIYERVLETYRRELSVTVLSWNNLVMYLAC